MTISYAGIGARKTPDAILLKLEMIGALLGARGYILRTGRAAGADTAFEVGARRVKGPMFLRVRSNWQPALDHAAKFHPNWEACDEDARWLHARNSMIMLGDGDQFNDPVNFVVCWTEGAKERGGTGQALRIANHYGVPVFNLADDGAEAALWTFVAGLPS